jgi:hypothetical protein
MGEIRNVYKISARKSEGKFYCRVIDGAGKVILK